MLLLGFLRSSAPFLAVGPIPSVGTTHTRGGKKKDDGGIVEDDADDDGGLEILPNNIRGGKRGTILVTLRNVVPYTQWCVDS